MKSPFVLLVFSVCWTYAGAVQAAPHVFHGLGVSFVYDDALLQRPKAHRVKALALATPTDIPEGVAPAHVKIQFAGDRGRLWVFPTNDPSAKDFRQAYPPHVDARKQLRAVLREHPAERQELPVLPWADVGMPFNKKIRYLDFRSGSGVAWLTQWTIDPAPINNAQLWYIFQGLTADGAHYVSVEIRVTHPSLPPQAEVKDYRAFEKQYPAYLAKAVKEIATQPDDSFQPSLARLRAMFESLELEAKP